MQSDDPEEIYDLYLKDNISIRYTSKNRLVPQMEIKFTKDALEEYQLERRIKLFNIKNIKGYEDILG